MQDIKRAECDEQVIREVSLGGIDFHEIDLPFPSKIKDLLCYEGDGKWIGIWNCQNQGLAVSDGAFAFRFRDTDWSVITGMAEFRNRLQDAQNQCNCNLICRLGESQASHGFLISFERKCFYIGNLSSIKGFLEQQVDQLTEPRIYDLSEPQKERQRDAFIQTIRWLLLLRSNDQIADG
jgi:hypothetical protein